MTNKKTFKKRLLIGVVALAGLFMIWLIFQSIKVFKQHEKIAARIQHFPVFQLNDMNGKQIRSVDVLNQKPVVLICFKTTCPFCQAEMTDLEKHPGISKNARIYLVSEESDKAVKIFYKEYHLHRLSGLDILLDPGHHFYQRMGVKSFPNTFVYNAKGNLIKHFRGEIRAHILNDVLHNR